MCQVNLTCLSDVLLIKLLNDPELPPRLLPLVALFEKVLAQVNLLVGFKVVVLVEQGREPLLQQGVHAHAPSSKRQRVGLPSLEEVLELGLVEQPRADAFSLALFRRFLTGAAVHEITQISNPAMIPQVHLTAVASPAARVFLLHGDFLETHEHVNILFLDGAVIDGARPVADGFESEGALKAVRFIELLIGFVFSTHSADRRNVILGPARLAEHAPRGASRAAARAVARALLDALDGVHAIFKVTLAVFSIPG